MIASNLLQRFFDEPGSHLVLNTDYTICEVGQDFQRITMTTRQQLVGKNVFEAFPDNPHWVGATGSRNLRASLDRVKKTLETDKLPPQRYDIRDREGNWVERWWDAATIPAIDNGKLEYLVIRLQDITLIQTVRKQLQRGRRENKILYLLALATLSLVSYGFVKINAKQNHISSQTCAIQRQQLPITHEQELVIQDIHRVLSFPLTDAQRRATPPRMRATVKDLNKHSVRYVHLVKSLPKTRNCS